MEALLLLAVVLGVTSWAGRGRGGGQAGMTPPAAVPQPQAPIGPAEPAAPSAPATSNPTAHNDWTKLGPGKSFDRSTSATPVPANVEAAVANVSQRFLGAVLGGVPGVGGLLNIGWQYASSHPTTPAAPAGSPKASITAQPAHHATARQVELQRKRQARSLSSGTASGSAGAAADQIDKSVAQATAGGFVGAAVRHHLILSE